jgi:Holliday junction resolvase RusA-like endonuclease
MIHLHIPSLPPSTNHAYFNLPRGGRALTNAGKRYKAETAAHLLQQYPAELAEVSTNRPYSVVYLLTVPTLLNKGFPDKAKNKYKALDVSNRVKLLEDVLAEVTALDDSTNMNVLAGKRLGPTEATEVWIFGDDDDPIQRFIDGLRGT